MLKISRILNAFLMESGLLVCQSGNVCQVGEEWKSDKIKVIPPLRGLSKSSISGSSIIIISNNITITKQCNHCNTIIIFIINVFPPFRDLSKSFSSESSQRSFLSPQIWDKKWASKEKTHLYRILDIFGSLETFWAFRKN